MSYIASDIDNVTVWTSKSAYRSGEENNDSDDVNAVGTEKLFSTDGANVVCCSAVFDFFVSAASGEHFRFLFRSVVGIPDGDAQSWSV